MAAHESSSQKWERTALSFAMPLARHAAQRASASETTATTDGTWPAEPLRIGAVVECTDIEAPHMWLW